MKRFSFVLAVLTCVPAFAQTFDGRWDLIIKTAADTYPSWLSVSGDKVMIVGRVSSVHPASDAVLKGTTLTFKSMEWFGKDTGVTWTLRAAGGKLTGTQKRSDGTEGIISAIKAPLLSRPAPAAWGAPTALFDGHDLNGWEPLNTEPGKPAESHWKIINGEMVNESPGANIRTKRTFTDFKLHVEFACPDEGNSGVYLRGRYEIQVAYQKSNDAIHGMGAVYGFLAPQAEISPKPGEWESFDVELVGRTVNVARNGVTITDHKEIPGITGGALDSREAQPGPLYIQGDHTGGMKYRNITIATPSK